MAELSRRQFVVKASMGAAAAGALAAAAPLTRSAAAKDTGAAEPDAPVAGGTPVVAHVQDFASGEVTLYSGTREVTVHDRALAAALGKAAAR